MNQQFCGLFPRKHYKDKTNVYSNVKKSQNLFISKLVKLNSIPKNDSASKYRLFEQLMFNDIIKIELK